MNYLEFITEIQKYYGPYENETVKKDTAEYIKETYYQSELEQLLRNIKKHFSIKWKTQPDIAVIISTEKEYELIHYSNGVRMIPDHENKKQIEDFTSEEIPEELFSELKKSITKNQEMKMEKVRGPG